MFNCSSIRMRRVAVGGLFILLCSGVAPLRVKVTQNPVTAIPDFSSNGVSWVTVGNDFILPPSGPHAVTGDPHYPHIRNEQGGQPNFRIADVTNPILKPWVVAQMKNANEEVLGGRIAYTPRSSCMPSGVPAFSLFIVEPVYFVQSEKEVLIVFSGDQQVRHVYMNVPHSARPRPSWYGESVGHYEGDTLIVDTIGQNAKTFVDTFRTPHTEKLHVVERYRLIDGGRTLEAGIRAEDTGAFNMPWQAIQRYRRVDYPVLEEVCAENNSVVFDYHIPQAGKPDF